jgi:hypothetical protein
MATGFTWAYNLGGGGAIIERIVVKASAVLVKGEMTNLESGEVDAGATADTAFVGPACEDCDNTADGLSVDVIVNSDAVYSVVDNNAREKGALLDLGTGGLTVAAASNNDLIVVEKSTATEPTLVTFNRTHYLT